ncbi:hypothetical protein BXZ70DRAFT_121848 [Cristinia sonorae]|uniref:Uncharacterized protein n=1 Tax=Cristinia sonorae TaxID=1940300 RepID=A0A8K0URX6_9AGAR|nr:hypothetical protein BXZ70DRAFT_121848 [Cristinia sonorae]
MGISRTLWRPVHSAYLRIVISKLSLTFFAFSTLYCIAQGVIQSFLINTDLGASNFVDAVLQEAQVPHVNVPWHTKHGNRTVLKICSDIPETTSYETCTTVYDSEHQEINNNWTTPVGFRRADVSYQPGISLLTIPAGSANAGTTMQAFRNSTGAITGVAMNTPDGSSFLSEQCTRVLLYPHQVLRTSKREEIILLVGQFWFFGISITALVFDSIPHLLALLCMRVLETIWSSYTVWRTLDLRQRFQILLVDEGSPCQSDLFPRYFRTRLSFQIPDLILNFTGLICIIVLGWHLIKAFNNQTFKRVGPPESVVRVYRFFLAHAVALHLSLFLMTAAMGLWADQLHTGPIANISTHTKIYNALFIFTVITLAPWCYMGSFAVRREMKLLMILFFSICFIYIACWSIMFYSQVYRWTWMQWPFFASMAIASFIVLIASGAFAVMCMLNFDKGLAHYLHVESVLAESDFQPEMFSNTAVNDVENNPWINGPIRSLSQRSNKPDVSVDIDLQAPVRSLSLKKDESWDFADTKRPAIFVVELSSNENFKAMSP